MSSDTLIEPAAQPAGPVQRAPLFALYIANTISAVGDVLMFIAVPWFVLQTTGSVVQTGLAAFFSTAAVAASALLGAPIVDRFGFRRASEPISPHFFPLGATIGTRAGAVKE